MRVALTRMPVQAIPPGPPPPAPAEPQPDPLIPAIPPIAAVP
jgi:hypothetical protein